MKNNVIDIQKNSNKSKNGTEKFNSDGWFNIITGMGTSRDKSTFNELQWLQTREVTAENLYAADEMGSKVARIIPYDGTREGVTFNMDKGADHQEVNKFIEKEFKRLKVWDTFSWAWILARVYGGAVVFLSVDDGRQLHRPLKWDKVKEIRNLTVFDRWELDVTSTDIIDDIADPDFGKPEFYTYQTANSPGAVTAKMIRIHHTRVIRFDGVQLPTRLYNRNGYWHDSIYGSLAKALSNYASTHNSIATIISDFNQPVYRIEGLTEAIAQDEDELVIKKLQTVDLMRSTARAIVLDKEDEFQNVSTNVAGGRELIDLTVQRLVAGSDVPHTRLLGNSPSGLGATGEAELINYYDSVKSIQNVTLRGPLDFIVEGIFSQTTATVEKPEDLTYEFNPLFQQNQEKEIKTRHLQAEIDEKYNAMGVYTPQETADARFGTGKYNYETVLEEGVVRVRPEPVVALSAGPKKTGTDKNNNADEDEFEGL